METGIGAIRTEGARNVGWAGREQEVAKNWNRKAGKTAGHVERLPTKGQGRLRWNSQTAYGYYRFLQLQTITGRATFRMNNHVPHVTSQAGPFHHDLLTISILAPSILVLNIGLEVPLTCLPGDHGIKIVQNTGVRPRRSAI
jgi:hypothetical protein